MIHVLWLPYWNPIIDYASSRLRCLYHHQNLNKYHSSEFTSSLVNQTQTTEDLATTNNILIVTQKINQENLHILSDFKKNKENILIYDIVDSYYNDPKAKSIFNLCDYVIVANDIQRQLVSKHVNKKIFVLSDPIDYEEQLDSTISSINKNIVWFGNNSGLINIKPLLHSLIPDYNVNIIGSKYYKNLIPGANLYEWKYETFISTLKLNNVCLLTHDLNQQQKSNNKLLASIANGVPVLSYKSRSYEEILRRFDLNYAIIKTRQDLINAITILLNNENRIKYFQRIQPYILKNYNSVEITKKLINIFDEILIKPKVIEKKLTQTRIIPNLIQHTIPKVILNNPTRKKILIYTANFGDYDIFHNIKTMYNDYFDYLYISDKPIVSNTWKNKIISKNDENFIPNNILQAKIFKILPHRFFLNYDISIWIDASAKNIQGNFLELINHLDTFNFIITKHPSRDCVFDEAIKCIHSKKGDPNKILKQIEKYEQEKYPHNNNLYQCGFLIRKHHEVKEFSEAWWEEINEFSIRDQISFPYIYNKYKDIVKLKCFESKECLKYFTWRRHNNVQLIKPKIFQKQFKMESN